MLKDMRTKEFPGYRAVMKMLIEQAPFEEKMCTAMLNKLTRCILRGDAAQAKVISKAIGIMFPKTDAVLADTKFNAFWQQGKYGQAIREYRASGRLFWLAEDVGLHYERMGRMGAAIYEYEYLIREYQKINVLPLPGGPEELFKVGVWYVKRDKKKARKYLGMYLGAEDVWKNDPAFFLRHKARAQRILNELKGGKK